MSQRPSPPATHRTPWRACAAGAVSLTIVALADRYTGPDVTLGPFYLVPIAIVAWWGGAMAGSIAGVLTAALWLLVQLDGGMLYHSKALVVLNAGLRALFNAVVAVVLAAWRDVGLRLERMVIARTAALQTLGAGLSAAEDFQRRQLAHDIHDALGQNLSLLRIHLEALAREHRLEDRVASEVRRIDDLIQQTRTLTFNLYPPMLDDLGLLAALEGYADEFIRRTGARVTVSQVGQSAPTEVGAPIAHYLFRSVRELMGNAVNHGHANEIVITLHWQPASLRITVDDDGAGFDPAAVTPRHGLGLAGIRQRLDAMGGAMQVESQKSQGTRVILQLAFHAALS